MSESTEAKLVAPCGINCGGCIAYFGYTMNGEREGSILAMVVGRDLDLVLLSKRNVRS
jgi:hypothetical protein